MEAALVLNIVAFSPQFGEPAIAFGLIDSDDTAQENGIAVQILATGRRVGWGEWVYDDGILSPHRIHLVGGDLFAE
jgi:hypothetical protein